MLSKHIIVSLALALSANAGVLVERAPVVVDCGAVNAAVNAATNGPAIAAAFCRQALALTPQYVTNTLTNFKTKTSTLPVTVTNTVTNAKLGTKTITQTAQTTTSVTVTPATVLVTNTITSTAYVDGEGNTLAIMKRAEPTHVLEARALPTPVFFQQYKGKAAIVAACNCLNLQPVVYTRTATLVKTTTAFVSKTYTAVATSVVPQVFTTKITTQVNSLTVQAPAPVSIINTVAYDNVFGCPPNQTPTFVCPDGTGDDDGLLASTNQLDCATQADDGYYGDCVYWVDDGSPFGSMLDYEDPTTGAVSTRPATYGDADSDDCPSWSDFTCAPMSSLGTHKRGLDGMSDIDSASALMARAVRHKKKTMPHGLRRGGHFRPYEQL